MSACALCGTPAPPPFRAPQPETAPDLDGRPGEPARSTLSRWVQACRGCGACAPDLTALPPGAAPLPGTPAYQALRSRHLRWAALVAGTPTEPEALLQAAWAAEDTGGDGVPLRRRALAVWPATADTDQLLRLSDIARRAGAFAEAGAFLDRLAPAPGEAAGRIAAFQRGRIAAADTGRHMLNSALRPPARMPHVAHGKPAVARPAGLWGRLFGSKRA